MLMTLMTSVIANSKQTDREEGVVRRGAHGVLPAGGLRHEPGHGLHALPWVQREVLLCTGGQGDDHRLADGARHARARPRRRCPKAPPGTPPVASSASGWHPWPANPAAAPAERRDIASSDSDATVGTTITPSTRPAARALVKPTSMSRMSCSRVGCDERQGEEAVDDRRDAGQQLHSRLEDLAHPRGGVLREVHGGAQAKRYGHQQGDQRDHQGARNERNDGVLALGGEEVAERHLPEEVDHRLDQRDHDSE